MTRGQRWVEWIGPAIFAGAMAAAWASGSSFWIYNATLVALYGVALVGLTILVGWAGQVSFAQTAFMAVGGYGVAILTTRLGWNPWVAWAVSVVLAVAGAGVIGWPLLRLRGHYLTMATFALAMGVYALANGATFTGGAIGISAVPPLRLAGLSLGSPVPALLSATVLCGLGLALALRLRASPLGRAWRALAARPDAAESLGVPVHRYKLLAFMLAALYGAAAGGLYVEFTTYVGPDLYSATIMVNLFLMLFIGGTQTPYGPLLGAAVVLVVPQLISGLSSTQGIVFDLVLLAIILGRPEQWRGLGAMRRRTGWAPSPVSRGTGSDEDGASVGVSGGRRDGSG